MSVKIRLQRHGRSKAPFYHIVVADSRAPRDGKFIEKLGTYNPLTQPATINIDRDKAFEWLEKGAEPSDTVAAILRYKGVMYRKHLARGVRKGALTQEQADEKLHAFVAQKENTIETYSAKTKADAAENKIRIFGTPKVKAAPVVVIEEVAAAAPAEEVHENNQETTTEA